MSLVVGIYRNSDGTKGFRIRNFLPTTLCLSVHNSDNIFFTLDKGENYVKMGKTNSLRSDATGR